MEQVLLLHFGKESPEQKDRLAHQPELESIREGLKPPLRWKLDFTWMPRYDGEDLAYCGAHIFVWPAQCEAAVHLLRKYQQRQCQDNCELHRGKFRGDGKPFSMAVNLFANDVVVSASLKPFLIRAVVGCGRQGGQEQREVELGEAPCHRTGEVKRTFINHSDLAEEQHPRARSADSLLV